MQSPQPQQPHALAPTRPDAPASARVCITSGFWIFSQNPKWTSRSVSNSDRRLKPPYQAELVGFFAIVGRFVFWTSDLSTVHCLSRSGIWKTHFQAELVDLAVWADTHSITVWRCRMAWWNTYEGDYDDEEPEVLIDLSE